MVNFYTKLYVVFLLALATSACRERVLAPAPTFKDPKGKVEYPGATNAHLIVENNVSYSFGNVNSGSVVETTIVVLNDGVKEATNIVATNPAAPFRYKGGSYPGTGGTCGVSLDIDDTCDLVVEYNPTTEGAFSDELLLEYESDGVAKEFLFVLSGTSGRADLTITDFPVFVFDNTLPSEVDEQTLTLSNTGDLRATFLLDSLALTGPFRYKGGVYPGTDGTCGALLNAGSDCEIVLEFIPPTSGSWTVVGANAGLWGFAYAWPGGGDTIQLALEGSSGNAFLEITDAPEYNFGLVTLGSFATRIFTISNTGNYVAENILDPTSLAAPIDYAGGTYPGIGGNCGTSLASGASCSIVIHFTPTELGVVEDTLELQYNNGVSVQTLELDFVGTPRGALLVYDAVPNYNFNRVAINTVQEATIAITNEGNLNASSLQYINGLNERFRFKGSAYPGVGGSCGTTLIAGASCNIVIEYAPTTGSAGEQITLRHRYNNGGGNINLDLSVDGQAGLAGLTFTAANPNFGHILNNTTAELNVTLRNNAGTGSGFDATDIEDALVIAPPFSFVGGTFPGTGGGNCSTSLAPGGSCILRLAYAPTSAGVDAGTLTLDYNNGHSVQQVTGSLSGESGLAELTISEAPFYDYGNVNNKVATGSRIFVLSNIGNWTATAISGAGLALPFRFATTGNFPGAGGNCGTTLAANASCNFVVTFSPTIPGPYNDTIEISYNDGNDPQQEDRNIEGISINLDPVANDLTPTVVAQTATPITLVATDGNTDSITYSIVANPSNGVLGAVAGNSVTYTPDAMYAGPDSFTYRVEDEFGALSNIATVNISVVPGALGTLVITGEPASVDAGDTFSLTVTAYDVNGILKTNYAGTVNFTSTDPSATLPAAYAFVPGDAGARTFNGIVLETVGTRTITARDNAAAIQDVSSNITVDPSSASAANSSISMVNDAAVSTAPNGTRVASVLVTLRDDFNNPLVGITPALSGAGVENPFCPATNGSGLATCTFDSTVAGIKGVGLSSPAGLGALSENVEIFAVLGGSLSAAGVERAGATLTVNGSGGKGTLSYTLITNNSGAGASVVGSGASATYTSGSTSCGVSDSVRVQDDLGQQLTLSPTATFAKIEVDIPNPHDFGSQTTQQSVNVVFRNTGCVVSGTLSTNALVDTVGVGGYEFFGANTCNGGTLAAAATCQVPVRFRANIVGSGVYEANFSLGLAGGDAGAEFPAGDRTMTVQGSVP